MMLGRLVAGTSANVARRGFIGAISPLQRTTVVMAPAASAAVLAFNLPRQQQQQRNRWTKAKKKRQVRQKRREAMAAKGIPVPKPPNYIDVNTPVVNAMTKEERLEESRQHDQAVSEELHHKLLEAEKPVLRHHMNGVRMSDRVRKLFDIHNGNQREVIQAQKHRGMEVFQLREGDTGSSAVQVIAITTRIQQLQQHMSKHRKDKHNKRRLDSLYVRRRKLLDYMERKEFESYRRVVKTLGLIR
jgi:small subunit ribosomal protein S15